MGNLMLASHALGLGSIWIHRAIGSADGETPAPAPAGFTLIRIRQSGFPVRT